MKKQLITTAFFGLLAAFAFVAIKAFAASTGNVWEARDKNNTFQVFIATGTTPADVQLDGVGLDASDVDRGELPNARLNSAVSLLGQTIESSEITDGTIVNADINASAAIAQSKVSGLVSDLEGKVSKAGDSMTGQLTLFGSTLTVTGNAMSVGGSNFVVKPGSAAVGFANPAQTFVVASENAAVLNVSNLTDSDFHIAISTLGATDKRALAGPNTSTDFAFGSGGSEKMRLKSDGKLGIGKTNPATALDVNGTATATAFSGDGSALTSLSAGNLSGQVAIANGGTGASSASGARSNLAVAGLADANTFTSNNTFQSTVTVQGAGSGAVASQIWRNASGTIVSSMSVSGQMSASAFIGDGSHLTGITAGSVDAANVNAGTFQNALYTFQSTVTINGLDFLGALNGTQIGARTCSSRPCVAYNTQDFDWYTTTGTALGQFRNSRSGTGVTQ